MPMPHTRLTRFRRMLGPAPLIAAAMLLTACSSTAGADPHQGWRVEASCASPATVATVARANGLVFARPARYEHAPTSTECTYSTPDETIAIGTQPGPPSDVTYDDAAGVHNTTAPALGPGAHLGDAPYFCGAAVPALGGDTLTVTITTTGDHQADCSTVTALVKASATWH